MVLFLQLLFCYNCLSSLFKIYKGTKNKEALFKQVREEMQNERRNVKLQSNDSVREAKSNASYVSPLCKYEVCYVKT